MNIGSILARYKLSEHVQRLIRWRYRRRKLTFDEYVQEIKEEPAVGRRRAIIFTVDDVFTNDIYSQDEESFDLMISGIKKIKNRFGINIIGFFIPKPKNWMHSEHFNIVQSSDIIRNRTVTLQNIFSDLGYHGLYHHSEKFPNWRSAWEFDGLNVNETKEKLINMKNAWPFSKPAHSVKFPAWAYSLQGDELRMVPLIREVLGVKRAFLSSPSHGLNFLNKKVSHCQLSHVYGITNFPQNVSLNNTFRQNTEIIDAITSKNGIISIQAHFSRNISLFSDGLSDQNFDYVEELLEYCQTRLS